MSTEEPVLWVALLGCLSLLPFFLMLTTSFCKYVVVLSLLRSAIGSPQVPPNVVITALAVALSGVTMAPTLSKAWAAATPHAEAFLERRRPSERLEAARAAIGAGWTPFADFLREHTDPADLQLLAPDAPSAEASAFTLVPAFLVSELSAAFRIAFVVFLPFLAVDLVVANVLMALGMQMMAPTTVSLPLKLLLFTAIDGWRVLADGLLGSYG